MSFYVKCQINFDCFDKICFLAKSPEICKLAFLFVVFTIFAFLY